MLSSRGALSRNTCTTAEYMAAFAEVFAGVVAGSTLAHKCEESM